MQMDFADAARNLETQGRRLYAARSVREAVLASATIFSLLGEIERQTEGVVRGMLGILYGSRANKAAGVTNGDAESYEGMKVADAAADFLRRHGQSHGKAIEKALLEGGLKTKAKFFQANLSTALKRDDRFRSLGPNQWDLREAVTSNGSNGHQDLTDAAEGVIGTPESAMEKGA